MRPNEVRIIGGSWRGRRIPVADLPGLRPTPDRVRETLFNWLGQDLTGRSCLDLFSGTGVLAFESCSRGAAPVVAVERHPGAARVIAGSAGRLGTAGLELVRDDALRFLARDRRRFDCIFVDPPFSEDWLPRLWAPLGTHLEPGGMVYIEQPEQVVPPAGWVVHRHDKAGQVHYHLLRCSEGSGNPTPQSGAAQDAGRRRATGDAQAGARAGSRDEGPGRPTHPQARPRCSESSTPVPSIRSRGATKILRGAHPDSSTR